MVVIHTGGFMRHGIKSVAFWRGTFRRGASGDAGGGPVCVDGGESKTGSCTSHTIDRIQIPLLFRCIGIYVSSFFYRSRIWREQEGPELWSSCTFMAVIFFKHMLQILIAFYRHQNVKFFRYNLVLQDHVSFKLCTKLHRKLCTLQTGQNLECHFMIIYKISRRICKRSHRTKQWHRQKLKETVKTEIFLQRKT